MNAAEWELLLQARDMLVNAPHGAKAAVTERAAQLLGCSVKTVYRRLVLAGLDLGRKQRVDAGKTEASIEDLKRISMTLMASRRDNGKQLWSAERALSACQANGLITTTLSPGRVMRLLRDNHLHPDQQDAPRAAVKLATPHPNYLWQIDSSTSVLYKDKTGVMRAMSSDVFYKNKPHNLVKVVNDLITRYVAVDHTSGAFKGRYYLGGESAENLIDFFIYAVTKQESSPMHGVPLHVYTDQGSGNKSGLWMQFLRNLGVKPLLHEPGRANATGQVEKHGDLWERGFEGSFPFFAPEQLTLDFINVEGERWAASFCATKTMRRHGMTRDSAWLLIKEGELRVPASVELLRDLAHSEPVSRRVSNTLDISFVVKGFGSRSYSVRDVPGILVGEKVMVAVNAYRAPAIDVRAVDRDSGEEVWHTVEPEILNEFGFPISAPVIGQSFRPAPKTVAEAARDELVRETYQQPGHALPTLEDAKRAKKQHQQAFSGALDPMKDVRETEVPTYMPRRGTDMPLAGRTLVPVTLTTIEACKRLKTQLGAAYDPTIFGWLSQRFPEGVPEDQLDVLATQYSQAQQPALEGDGTTGLRIVR